MKIAKKLLAVLLVAMMVMALGATAFAATATSTLTVEAVAGHTYKVYQMLTGDVSGLTNGSGTLANVALGSNNKAADVTTFDNALRVGGVATGAYLTDDALAEAAEDYITGDPVASLTTTTKSATVTNGYYIIQDTWTDSNASTNTGALSRYMVAVVGNTTVTPKTTTTPTIDKNIIDTDANAALETGDSKKTDTAAIGDTINYEVTGTVPDMTGYEYYYYVLNDTLSKGLTLDESSIVVTVGGKTQSRGTNYHVYTKTNDDGTTSFKLAFENMVAQYTKGADISIKYNATVNDQAATGLDPNTNTATLIYSNDPNTSDRNDEDDTPDEDNPSDNPDVPDSPSSDNPGEPGVPDDTPDTPSTPKVPTGETTKRITKTYVTELTIIKVDEDNAILDGAQFTLTGDNLTKVELTTATSFDQSATGDYYKITVDSKTSYTKEEPTADTASYYEKDAENNYVKYALKVTVASTSTAAPATGVVMTLANGAFTVKGLNAGDYTLKETVTPEGYNTIGDVDFTISASTDNATSTVGGDIKWSDNDNATVKLNATTGLFGATIQNVKGNLLPSTGGMGTTIFYVVGTILVCGAGILLVSKKRMTKVTEK